MQRPTRTPRRPTASYPTLMCSFRWPLRQGVHGTIGRWNWYGRLEDGRPTLYRRCQGVHVPVPAADCGTTEWECGLISKHVHRQLVRCNPLFHFLNVLVSTGFVLVGHKNNKNLCGRDGRTICGPQCVPKSTSVSL